MQCDYIMCPNNAYVLKFYCYLLYGLVIGQFINVPYVLERNYDSVVVRGRFSAVYHLKIVVCVSKFLCPSTVPVACLKIEKIH